jgi:single-strand DNA-binding protein
MSINISATGRLTAAPELRSTPNGKQVVVFDLAHNFRTRVGEKWIDVETLFFRCSMWEDAGGLALLEQHLAKGDLVTVEGTWSKRAWIGKDGNRRIGDEVRVTSVRAKVELAGGETVAEQAAEVSVA